MNSRPTAIGSRELEGDTILESEYILLAGIPGPARIRSRPQGGTVHSSTQQLDGGGWTTYPGGRVDISASVKAYFALKLTGHDPSSRSRCSGHARPSWPTAAPTRSTASRASTWRCWARFPTNSARRFPPESVLLPRLVADQSVQSQRLVADDHRAAVDHVGLSPVTKLDPRAGHLRAVSQAAGSVAAAALSGTKRGHGPAELGSVLPHVSIGDQILPTTAAGCRCAAGRWPSAERWMIERFEAATGWAPSFRR